MMKWRVLLKLFYSSESPIMSTNHQRLLEYICFMATLLCWLHPEEKLGESFSINSNTLCYRSFPITVDIGEANTQGLTAEGSHITKSLFDCSDDTAPDAALQLLHWCHYSSTLISNVYNNFLQKYGSDSLRDAVLYCSHI